MNEDWLALIVGLALLGASVIGTLYLQCAGDGKATIATVNGLRTWLLVLAFVAAVVNIVVA